MDENDEVCLELGLGLGLSDYVPKKDSERKNKRVIFLDFSIPLPSNNHKNNDSSSSLKFNIRDEEKLESKNSFCIGCKEDDDTNYSTNCTRKKLRLTSDQSILLEDSFKQHNTLNTAQKLALAEKLSLKPRQIEVWFQNRRARTKLKQTERDYEFLKKNCERLSEENRRLRMELQDLRSTVKMENSPAPAAPQHAPFFYQIPTAAVKTCASCEKIEKGRGGGSRQESTAIDVVHD